MVKPRPKPVKSIIAQLTSGHGAQRLTPALKAIEIRDVPTRGALAGQRAFVKTILPKLKYHNSRLEILTNFIEGPPKRKGKGKRKEAVLDEAEIPSSKILFNPIIQLHFHELPSQVLPMADKSAVEINREMLALIHKTLGRDAESEITGGAALVDESLSESATLPEADNLADEVVKLDQNKDTASVQETPTL